MSRPPLRAALRPFGTTIFAEMSRLALEHGAVNLGQGFPDFPGPSFVKDAACEAIAADHNQYAPLPGIPAIRTAIAEKMQRFYGLTFDPQREITVYAGCTEAIHVALMALCEPGDEVILLQPYYDSYRACVAMAGATPRFVTLHAPEFRWDPAELQEAWSDRTRVILFNSPHNPTGRVFGEEEMEQVARLARKHDTYVVTDEVYEHLVYEGRHAPMAGRPGMADRTVTLNSTGKTFSLTGWKIGYSLAPPDLTRALQTVHQFVTFAVATPFQHAMAAAIATDDTYYVDLLALYRAKRDRLVQMLRDVGFTVEPPAGTYFVCAGIEKFGFADDVAFCRHLIEEVGVVAIPPSAFYDDPALGRSYVRFAFCKTDEVLDEAGRRLERLR